MRNPKAKWILAMLRISPMDRIHIMKALFLLGRRGGDLPNFFKFEPYLYGPCSFELYTLLEELVEEGLIVQPPHPAPRWGKYYLTPKGKIEADRAFKEINPQHRYLLKEVTREVGRMGFYELLKYVYKEAPEFAVNSVVREALEQ